MKAYEAIELLQGPLQKLHDAGIKAVDYKLVDLYKEYSRLKGDGLKICYIVAHLSDQYGMSQRSVYSTIKKLEQDIY